MYVDILLSFFFLPSENFHLQHELCREKKKEEIWTKREGEPRHGPLRRSIMSRYKNIIISISKLKSKRL